MLNQFGKNCIFPEKYLTYQVLQSKGLLTATLRINNLLEELTDLTESGCTHGDSSSQWKNMDGHRPGKETARAAPGDIPSTEPVAFPSRSCHRLAQLRCAALWTGPPTGDAGQSLGVQNFSRGLITEMTDSPRGRPLASRPSRGRVNSVCPKAFIISHMVRLSGVVWSPQVHKNTHWGQDIPRG